MFSFNSFISIRNGSFKSDWPQEIVKNEPMLFNADLQFSMENGGPITRNFLENMPEDWKNCNPVIDSRVHMLMKKWYPCIPGYHHDDVGRSDACNGQPDYDNMQYKSEHLTGLVNGDICATKFAIGQFTMPRVDTSKDVIYRKWDEIITAKTDLLEVSAPSGRYIQFDWSTFHTGVRAKDYGWRWFIRLSRNTNRQKTITNELRRQVQVYLEYPTMGW